MSIRDLAEAAVRRYAFATAAVDPRTGAIQTSGSDFRAYNRRLRPWQRYQDGGSQHPTLLVEGVAVTGGDEAPFEPRTELGRRLLALRAEYRGAGGPVQTDWDDVETEVESRRGGVRESHG